jgi:hypothetical protein
MATMAIHNQVGMRESIERKPWTCEDWRESLVFLAESAGLVCAAIFFYSLGPNLSMALIAVSLAVWSLLSSQIACEEEEDGLDEDSGRAMAANSPSRCADPAWLRNPGASSASTVRPVMQQGA